MSLFAGLLALGVSAHSYRSFIERRVLHHVLWAVGLTLWGLSDLSQASALLWGWSTGLYKLYYFSAIALVGFLGAGTLGMVSRGGRASKVFTAYILAMTLVLGVMVAASGVDEEALREAVVGGLAMPGTVRMLTPLINIPGGIAFIGGAVYSLVKLRRGYALFITIGAVAPMIGGVMARLGNPGLLPLADLVGTVALAAGVYLALRK